MKFCKKVLQYITNLWCLMLHLSCTKKHTDLKLNFTKILSHELLFPLNPEF